MTLERARILKDAAFSQGLTPLDPVKPVATSERARIVPREVLEARDEAAKIVADAKASVVRAIEKASSDAKEAELARLSAIAIELKKKDEARAMRGLDRTIEVAKLLAERLVGEQLTITPARIAELAAAALEQTRGARNIRIEANPDDVAALRDMLASVGVQANVEADEALGRGSLMVHTDLGAVDARLTPQLDRLAEVLREGAVTKEHA